MRKEIDIDIKTKEKLDKKRKFVLLKPFIESILRDFANNKLIYKPLKLIKNDKRKSN